MGNTSREKPQGEKKEEKGGEGAERRIVTSKRLEELIKKTTETIEGEGNIRGKKDRWGAQREEEKPTANPRLNAHRVR